MHQGSEQPASAVLPVTSLSADADSTMLLTFLDVLMQNAAGPMYLRSAGEGRYLLVSAELASMLGRPVENILGRTTAEIFGEKVAGEQLLHDRMIRADGQARVVAERLITADGSEMQLITHKFPLHGPDGEIFAIGGVGADLAGQEGEIPTTQTIRFDRDTEISAVLENSPVGLELIGPGGRIVTVNEALCTIVGDTSDGLIGRPAIEIIAPQSRAGLEHEVAELLAGERAHLNAVRWMTHRDGHVFPVRMTTTVIRDADGSHRYMMAMIFDLTEEERTRENLAREHSVAVRTAARFTLLHSVAAAANEATTLTELAPRALGIVCEQLGWHGGCLVEWNDETPRCLHRHGEMRFDTGILTPPRPGDDPALIESETGPYIVIPIEAAAGAPKALIFDVPDSEFTDWQPDLLQLIAGECAHVVERENAIRAQRKSDDRFRSVFDTSPLAMGITTRQRGEFTNVNAALCDMVGRSRDELVGARFRSLVDAEDLPLISAGRAAEVASTAEPRSDEMRLHHADGSVVVADVSVAWVDSAYGDDLLLVQLKDITARRAAERALRHQADHDVLTGLVNRAYLMRTLGQLAADGEGCALLFVDLDGFKPVNDRFGHEIGDEVLVVVAQRLRATLRTTDLVARLGGDEFIVLCRSLTDSVEQTTARAEQIAIRIGRAVAAPVMTSAGVAHVTASVGVAAAAPGDVDPAALLKHADIAMYQAKGRGKGCSVTYSGDRSHEPKNAI